MSSISVPARTTMYLTKKFPFRVSTNNYCKATTTDNIYTFTIKPDTSLLGDVMYVAYDVRVEGQTIIPRGTQVLVDWVTESTPTIAAQVQVTTIFLDGVAQEISADSPIIDVSTEYNNWEVMNANNMYRILKYRSTANMIRRLVDNHCLMRVLPDGNLNTVYLEIYTNEIPVFLNETFTPSERPVTVVPEPEVIVRRPIYKIQPRLGRTEEVEAVSSSIVSQAIEETQIITEPIEEVACPGEKKWTYCDDCTTDTFVEKTPEEKTTDTINDWIRRNNDIIASVDTMLEGKKEVVATDLSLGKCGCKEVYGSCGCSELDETGQCICVKTYGKCNCGKKKGGSKCLNSVCNKKESIKRESVVNQRNLVQTQIDVEANSFTPSTNQRTRKQWSIPPGVKPESKAAHNSSARLSRVNPQRRTLPKFRRQ